MKFLCICQYGHSRSVALCRVLHGKNLPAVAAGYSTSGNAINVLAEWADVIALMTPEAMNRIPKVYQSKVVSDFDIGPDKWSNPYNQELLSILKDKVDFFLQGKEVAT